jgi:hypothetical protein
MLDGIRKLRLGFLVVILGAACVPAPPAGRESPPAGVVAALRSR